MVKIGIVGVGAVGSSYLYAALNKGVEADYVLIDTFEKYAEAQAKDLNDAASSMPNCGSTFKAGKYEDLNDAKIVVITASCKPKEGKLQDRMELLKDNATLIKCIAENIKKSGFSGVTIIASNPVDIMACIFQQVTGFKQYLRLREWRNSYLKKFKLKQVQLLDLLLENMGLDALFHF